MPDPTHLEQLQEQKAQESHSAYKLAAVRSALVALDLAYDGQARDYLTLVDRLHTGAGRRTGQHEGHAEGDRMTETVETWSRPTLLAMGHTVVHANERRGVWEECRTTWPAVQCTCGHFRLEWSVTPEALARLTVPPKPGTS